MVSVNWIDDALFIMMLPIIVGMIAVIITLIEDFQKDKNDKEK